MNKKTPIQTMSVDMQRWTLILADLFRRKYTFDRRKCC